MSQSTLEKRTVITTSTSSSSIGGGGSASMTDGGDDFYYKSSIHPRNTSISHSNMIGSGGSGGGSYKRTVEISSGMLPSGYGNVSHTGVTTVKSSREKEKKDMQQLNERFANYIEKVRFLEAQNKKLISELDQLRQNWGKETSAIKKMYETELEEARNVIEETNKEKNKLEVKVQKLQEQLNDAMKQLEEAKKWRGQDRETINKLNQQVSELEGEIRMLRRTTESLDTERQRDKATIARLQSELEKLRIDLSNEMIARLDAENKYQTLLEEIEFLKSVHEQELKELSALAYRDTTAENREFWKNELSQAIRDIQQEYDTKVDQIRGEMETFYNLKVQEFRTGATKQNMEVTHAREETKKLQKMLGDSRTRLADLEARNAQLEKQYQDLLRELEQKEHEHDIETNSLKEEMNKQRAELEGMLVELQTLMDAKLSLELEIAAYRKLLEGEETRIPLRKSFRHPYTPFSTVKSDSNGAPNGASTSPPPNNSYMFARTSDVEIADETKGKGPAGVQDKGTPDSKVEETLTKSAVSTNESSFTSTDNKPNEATATKGESETGQEPSKDEYGKDGQSDVQTEEKVGGDDKVICSVEDEKIPSESSLVEQIEDQIIMKQIEVVEEDRVSTDTKDTELSEDDGAIPKEAEKETQPAELTKATPSSEHESDRAAPQPKEVEEEIVVKEAKVAEQTAPQSKEVEEEIVVKEAKVAEQTAPQSKEVEEEIVVKEAKVAEQTAPQPKEVEEEIVVKEAKVAEQTPPSLEEEIRQAPSDKVPLEEIPDEAPTSEIVEQEIVTASETQPSKEVEEEMIMKQVKDVKETPSSLHEEREQENEEISSEVQISDKVEQETVTASESLPSKGVEEETATEQDNVAEETPSSLQEEIKQEPSEDIPSVTHVSGKDVKDIVPTTTETIEDTLSKVGNEKLVSEESHVAESSHSLVEEEVIVPEKTEVVDKGPSQSAEEIQRTESDIAESVVQSVYEKAAEAATLEKQEPSDTVSETARKNVQDTSKHTDTVEDTSKQTDTVEDTPTQVDTVEDTSKQTDTVEDTPSQVDTVEDTSKQTDTVEDTPTQVDTVKGTSKETDTVEDTSKQTDTVDDTPTQVDTVEDTSKQTDTVEDTPKQTDTVEHTPKQTDTVEDTPKQTDTVEDTPKQTDTVEDTPKETDSVKDTSKETELVEDTSKQTDTVEDTSKESEPVEDTSKQTDTLENTSKQRDTAEDTPKQTEPVEVTPKQTDAAEDISKQTDTVEDTPKEADTEAVTPKQTDSVEYTPKQVDTVGDTPKQADTVEDTPKQADTAEDTLKEADTADDTPKQTDTVEDTPKQTDTVEDTPKQTDTVEDTPKQTDTVEDTPKQADTAEDTPKQADTAKDTSKETDTVKDTSKQTETVEDTPKQADTVEDTHKETDTAEDTPKEIETADDTSKQSVTVEDTPKETDTVEDTPKQSETVEDTSKRTDTAEDTSKQSVNLEDKPKQADTVEGTPTQLHTVVDTLEQTDTAEVTPKETDTAEVTPKETDTAKDTPKQTESVEDTPKQTDNGEDTPKQTDTSEDTPELTETTEDTPKQTDTSEDTPELTETTEDTPKQTDSVEGTSKQIGTTEDIPKETDILEDAPTQKDAAEDTPKQTEEQEDVKESHSEVSKLPSEAIEQIIVKEEKDVAEESPPKLKSDSALTEEESQVEGKDEPTEVGKVKIDVEAESGSQETSKGPVESLPAESLSAAATEGETKAGEQSFVVEADTRLGKSAESTVEKEAIISPGADDVFEQPEESSVISDHDTQVPSETVVTAREVKEVSGEMKHEETVAETFEETVSTSAASSAGEVKETEEQIEEASLGDSKKVDEASKEESQVTVGSDKDVEGDVHDKDIEKPSDVEPPGMSDDQLADTVHEAVGGDQDKPSVGDSTKESGHIDQRVLSTEPEKGSDGAEIQDAEDVGESSVSEQVLVTKESDASIETATITEKEVQEKAVTDSQEAMSKDEDLQEPSHESETQAASSATLEQKLPLDTDKSPLKEEEKEDDDKKDIVSHQKSDDKEEDASAIGESGVKRETQAALDTTVSSVSETAKESGEASATTQTKTTYSEETALTATHRETHFVETSFLSTKITSDEGEDTVAEESTLRTSEGASVVTTKSEETSGVVGGNAVETTAEQMQKETDVGVLPEHDEKVSEGTEGIQGSDREVSESTLSATARTDHAEEQLVESKPLESRSDETKDSKAVDTDRTEEEIKASAASLQSVETDKKPPDAQSSESVLEGESTSSAQGDRGEVSHEDHGEVAETPGISGDDQLELVRQKTSSDLTTDDRLEEDGGEALADDEHESAEGKTEAVDKAKDDGEANEESLVASEGKAVTEIEEYDTLDDRKGDGVTVGESHEETGLEKDEERSSDAVRSPLSEEDVIISTTFTLSESSAKFLSEPEYVVKTAETVEEVDAENARLDGGATSRLGDTVDKNVEESHPEDLGKTDLSSEQDGISTGESRGPTEAGGPQIHVETTDIVSTSTVSEVQDGTSGQEKVATSKAEPQVKLLDEPKEVKETDDEVEEESLLVNGVKEDLMDASSPEVSLFDQGRADNSIATSVPGGQKDVANDTDEDVLNDDDMGIDTDEGNSQTLATGGKEHDTTDESTTDIPLKSETITQMQTDVVSTVSDMRDAKDIDTGPTEKHDSTDDAPVQSIKSEIDMSSDTVTDPTRTSSLVTETYSVSKTQSFQESTISDTSKIKESTVSNGQTTSAVDLTASETQEIDESGAGTSYTSHVEGDTVPSRLTDLPENGVRGTPEDQNQLDVEGNGDLTPDSLNDLPLQKSSGESVKETVTSYSEESHSQDGVYTAHERKEYFETVRQTKTEVVNYEVRFSESNKESSTTEDVNAMEVAKGDLNGVASSESYSGSTAAESFNETPEKEKI